MKSHAEKKYSAPLNPARTAGLLSLEVNPRPGILSMISVPAVPVPQVVLASAIVVFCHLMPPMFTFLSADAATVGSLLCWSGQSTTSTGITGKIFWSKLHVATFVPYDWNM